MEQWLECQECGDKLRLLTQQQTQMVAQNPYNYVVYCLECKKDIEKKIERKNHEIS